MKSRVKLASLLEILMETVLGYTKLVCTFYENSAVFKLWRHSLMTHKLSLTILEASLALIYDV